MGTTESGYLETTTLRQVLNISDGAMDQAMGIAYQLYRGGRFVEAATVCKGLIACDHHYWWPHSLHASALRQLGRHDEALTAVESGLKYEPGQPKLLLMRAELTTTIARKQSQEAARAKSQASSSVDVHRGAATATSQTSGPADSVSSAA